MSANSTDLPVERTAEPSSTRPAVVRDSLVTRRWVLEYVLRLAQPVLRSQFARNWSFLVLSNVCGQGFALLATIRLARALEPQGYGQFNLVQTLAGLGAIVGGLGLRNVLIRACARDPYRSAALLWASALLRGVTSVLVGTGIILYSKISQQELPPTLIVVAVGLLLAFTAWDTVESVAFGHQNMGLSAVINLSGSMLWAMMVWGAPGNWLTLVVASAAYSLLQAGKAVSYAAIAYRWGLFKGGISRLPLPRLSQSLLTQSLPFYWLALLTAATGQLPILFLAERSGQAEIGLYTVGFRLVYPVDMIIAAMLTALYPGLSKIGVGDDDGFSRVVRRSLFGIVILGTAGALVLSLIREEMVLLLFGTAYRAAADATAYQCWYAVLYAVFAMIGTTLGARDRQKQLAWLATAYALVATPVLWVGASFGAAGLASAALLAASLNLTYHWVVFQRSLRWALPTSFTVTMLLIFSSGLVVGWAVPQSWSWQIRVLICLCALGFYLGIGARSSLPQIRNALLKASA
jgi:lipopolysaccharide exporter